MNNNAIRTTPIQWANTRVRLGDLQPWAQNPRHITRKQAERLAESFSEFGQVETIAIGPSHEVYNGHQRLSVLLKLHGPQYEIDARQSSRALTDDERRKLVVFLHAGAVGGWDWDKVSAWSAPDLMQWGFDADTLQAWKGDIAALGNLIESETPEPQDAEPQIDRAAELQEKWQVKTGDLWRIGEHRLLCDDSIKPESIERVLQGDRAAIVSDPPYGIKVDTAWLSALNVKHGKPRNKSDDKLANDDGTLDLSWIYKYREWLVFGFPSIARHENYTGLLVWDKRGEGGETGLGNPIEVAASNAFNGYRLARHVWAGYVREAGEKREEHPTQKPIGIMVDAVKLVKNAIILDPFVGSGTTIVACEWLGRKCRAIEIGAMYTAICLERMATAFLGIEIERIE